MPAKLVTYNSQNYAGTLGSGLILIYVIRFLASDFNTLKIQLQIKFHQTVKSKSPPKKPLYVYGISLPTKSYHLRLRLRLINILLYRCI